MAQGVLRQWFERTHQSQRKMAEDLILTPVDDVGGFLAREQVVGTISQMRLTNELFGRLEQEIQIEISNREKSQQPNRQ